MDKASRELDAAAHSVARARRVQNGIVLDDRKRLGIARLHVLRTIVR